jgi:hypothetical protein
MVKNTPYLFGGALTISSIVAFSFIAPNIEKYFKSQNLKSHQNVVLSAFKKEIEKPEQEGKYLEYAAPLVGCEFSYNLNAAATYFISSLQGVDVACITNDRNNAIFPVGGLGVQPPEALAWGFKIQPSQIQVQDFLTARVLPLLPTLIPRSITSPFPIPSSII